MSVKLWKVLRISGLQYKLRQEGAELVVEGMDLDAERAAAEMTGSLSHEVMVLLVLREQIREGRQLEHVLDTLKELGPVSSASQIGTQWAGDPVYLALLAGSPHPEIRRVVAANPHLHRLTMERMAAIEDESVQTALAQRRDLSPGAARILHRAQLSMQSAKALATNPNVPEELLVMLAGERMTVYDVAQNPAAPISVLERLCEHEDERIRNAVGENSSTPLVILRRLAQDPEERVRQGVASNVNAPLEVLQALADDASAHVRCRVAQNASISVEIAARLLRDPDEVVRRLLAQNHLLPLTLRERLLLDPDQTVRSKARKLMGPDPINYDSHHSSALVLPPRASREEVEALLQDRPVRAAQLLEMVEAGLQVSSALSLEELREVAVGALGKALREPSAAPAL